MKKTRSFTLMELLIALCIIGALAVISVLVYRNYVEKAKTAEAVVTVNQISKAEELHKMENGSYVAAANTSEINERLGTAIAAKNFEYRVVGVTKDNFIVIAQKIGLDIREGALSEPSSVVVAVDRSGPVGGYEPYIAGGGQAGGQIIGDVAQAGYDAGGGYGGGYSGGGAIGTGGTTGGGQEPTSRSAVERGATLPVYDASIQGSLGILDSLTADFYDASPHGRTLDSGKYYYDLIADKGISVIYSTEGMTSTTGAYWYSATNTIYVNESLKTAPNWPEEAIACLILHEALHADYYYYPEKWENRIMIRWGQALANHDPAFTSSMLYTGTNLTYTRTEEYFTHCITAAAWISLKGTYTNDNLDGFVADYNAGEAELRAYLAVTDPYDDLPEYYTGY